MALLLVCCKLLAMWTLSRIVDGVVASVLQVVGHVNFVSFSFFLLSFLVVCILDFSTSFCSR